MRPTVNMCNEHIYILFDIKSQCEVNNSAYWAIVEYMYNIFHF